MTKSPFQSRHSFNKPKTMEVVAIAWDKEQASHEGHKKAGVTKGQKVFAVKCGERFFHYAYLSEAYAQSVASRLDGSDEQVLAANFKDRPFTVSSRVKD